MKILFLDFDGVLNTENGLKTLSNNWTDMKSIIGNPFCPQAIECLRKIINETGAKIVVSSTWRSDGLQRMKEMWEERNLPGEIIDITPNDKTRVRGKEVDSWLHDKGYYYPADYWSAPIWEEARKNCEIESYCIVDDDWDFFILQQPHYVNVSAYYGLAQEGKVDEIIRILNTKCN